MALCFLWVVIGPRAFFPFPLSVSLCLTVFFCTCFARAWCSLETQAAKANDFRVKGHTCGQKNNAINTEKQKQTYRNVAVRAIKSTFSYSGYTDS